MCAYEQQERCAATYVSGRYAFGVKKTVGWIRLLGRVAEAGRTAILSPSGSSTATNRITGDELVRTSTCSGRVWLAHLQCLFSGRRGSYASTLLHGCRRMRSQERMSLQRRPQTGQSSVESLAEADGRFTSVQVDSREEEGLRGRSEGDDLARSALGLRECGREVVSAAALFQR